MERQDHPRTMRPPAAAAEAAQGADASAIDAALRRDGFAFVRAPRMRALLEAAGARDWDGFAASWGDLGLDSFMADGGRYRRRRFACFAASLPDGIRRKPHQPHYQSRDYNPLNGGVERWFEPVTEAIAAHPTMRAILATCHALFDRLTPPEARPDAWHVEAHQFRIEARPGEVAARRARPPGCASTEKVRR